MEENQQEGINVQVEEKTEAQKENNNPEVGFPLSSQKTKKKNSSLIFIILGIVILVGGIIFFVTKGKKESESMVSPTPTSGVVITTSTPTATPEPANKENVTVQVLNGTGISGEAGYLQGVLKTLGYSDIEVGNADKQDQEITTVTFSDTLDEANKSEIKTKLESLYENVTVKTSASADFDVSIVTGLRKGQTAKPSATPTATPEESESPSPTPTETTE